MTSLIQQQEGSYIKDHVHVGAGAVLGGAQQVAEQVVPAAHRLLVLGLQVVEKRREVQVQDAAVVEQAPVIEVHNLSRADHRPLLFRSQTLRYFKEKGVHILRYLRRAASRNRPTSGRRISSAHWSD
jgi:ribosomal protein L24